MSLHSLLFIFFNTDQLRFRFIQEILLNSKSFTSNIIQNFLKQSGHSIFEAAPKSLTEYDPKPPENPFIHHQYTD